MTKSLSILIVLHDFALGGTERIAVRLAGAWAREGATVTIFCGSEDGELRPLLDPSVAVVAARPTIARGPGSRRKLARALRRWAARSAFDIAFVPGNYHWSLAPTLADLGMPVIAQVSAALDKPQRGPVRQWLFDLRMRRLLTRVAAVIALTDRARDQADRILARAVGTAIPLPALDDATAAPLPLPPSEAPMILAVGRLVPEKGFATLVAAFARIDHPQARLTIVGDGPELKNLERQAQALGIADRVALPGYASDVRPWLDEARLFVLASRFEGYPAVIVEALAAGRPVVATDCTPATALLDGDAGAVVPIDDAPALAAAIDRMLAAKAPDPARLAASVAHHRIGPVARAYLALFATVAR